MGIVSIRQLSLEDTDDIVRWRNTPSVKRNLYTQTEISADQHIQYYKKIVCTGKCAQFIIVIENNGIKQSIGTAFIKNLDFRNRSGEYGIFIGEEGVRGKGYAKEATKLILKFGFETLQLHRIYLTVMADNYPAIKAYTGVGFKQEGIERDGYFRENGFVDIIIMAILENEWKQNKK